MVGYDGDQASRTGTAEILNPDILELFVESGISSGLCLCCPSPLVHYVVPALPTVGLGMTPLGNLSLCQPIPCNNSDDPDPKEKRNGINVNGNKIITNCNDPNSIQLFASDQCLDR